MILAPTITRDLNAIDSTGEAEPTIAQKQATPRTPFRILLVLIRLLVILNRD
jgi:hypothetical protein